MPTYTVGPGKTYATITAAVAAIPSNISGTGVHNVIVDSGSYNSFIVAKTGSSASDYIHFYAASGSEHLGIGTNGVKVEDGGFDSTCVFTSTSYTRFTNIVAVQLIPNNLGRCFTTDADNVTFINCIARCSMAGNFSVGFYIGGSNNLLINCIAFPTGFNSTTSTVGYFCASSSDQFTKIYNCAAYGLRVGFSFGSDTNPIIRNSWTSNMATGGFPAVLVGASISYCASDDTTTSLWPNSYSNISISSMGFVSTVLNDFHITNNSFLRSKGTDLSAVFTIDWDNTTISQWSIGPDAIPTLFNQFTSSTPWRGDSETIDPQDEAGYPQLKQQGSTPAPKLSSNGKTNEAKFPALNKQKPEALPGVQKSSSERSFKPPPTIPAPKGYKNGWLAIMPETGGYNGALGFGTGNKVTLISDGLTTGKQFQDKALLGMDRSGAERSVSPIEPKGKFSQELRSNDSIPLFMSHFQNRMGTTPLTGTTYYEFYPSREKVTTKGSAFGTGAYTSTAARNAFTVSVIKAVSGSVYHYKSGVCDKLGFNFNPKQTVTVEADFAFGTVTLTGTSAGTPYGDYSSLRPYYGWNCSVNFLGLPLTGFSFVGDNNLSQSSALGTDTRYYRFGRYEVQGRAEVDLPPNALAYIQNSLGGSSFTVYGTMLNDNRDKIVFQMGSCCLGNVEYNLKENKMVIPFHSYESEDGNTPPLKLMVWTRNYSATTFEPN